MTCARRRRCGREGSRDEDYNGHEVRNVYGGLFLSVLVLPLILGCGGATDDPLIGDLPEMAPTQEDVSDQLADWGFALRVVPEATGPWSNEALSAACGISVSDVRNTGRVAGYQAAYRGGPYARGWLVFAGITLNIHDSEQSAVRSLKAGPCFSSGPQMESYVFGDGGAAWPMSSASGDSVNQFPACPCQVWVRQGRLVGTVDVSHGGPPPDPTRVTPDAVSLAKLLAERMQAATE